MGIFTALGTGIKRTHRSLPMVFVLYLLNLVLAVPLAMAFQSIIVTRIGNSDALSGMLSEFQFQIFDEFLLHYGGEISALLRQCVWLGIIALMFNTLTAGGILLRHRESESPFSLSAFCAGCGHYVGRFLNVLLLILPLVLLLALLWGGIISAGFSGFSGELSSEVPLFFAAITAFILVLLPLGLLLVISDYIRVMIVLDAGQSVLREFRRAFTFVFRNFFAVISLQLLLLLLALLFFAVYVLLDLTIGMSDTLSVIIMTIIGQLYLGIKMWIRSVSYGAQLSLYESRKSPEFAVESIELTPPLTGL